MFVCDQVVCEFDDLFATKEGRRKEGRKKEEGRKKGRKKERKKEKKRKSLIVK